MVEPKMKVVGMVSLDKDDTIRECYDPNNDNVWFVCIFPNSTSRPVIYNGEKARTIFGIDFGVEFASTPRLWERNHITLVVGLKAYQEHEFTPNDNDLGQNLIREYLDTIGI